MHKQQEPSGFQSVHLTAALHPDDYFLCQRRVYFLQPLCQEVIVFIIILLSTLFW